MAVEIPMSQGPLLINIGGPGIPFTPLDVLAVIDGSGDLPIKENPRSLTQVK